MQYPQPLILMNVQWHNQICTDQTKITLKNSVYAKIKVSSDVSVGIRE
jgi:hypothetical protein